MSNEDLIKLYQKLNAAVYERTLRVFASQSYNMLSWHALRQQSQTRGLSVACGPPVVNFINILHENFLFESSFKVRL